jgi:4'-phosphopantetheinyl transferase
MKMPDAPPTDHVDVWATQTDDPALRERLRGYRRLLSIEEARRAERFLHADDAMRFIVGRALARTMLSRYADVPPRDWLFVIDGHGRPELAARPAFAPDLRFNLTHTIGLVACAVTVGREVGIDVEHIGRSVTYDVPERFFSPQEVADLRALPDEDQQTAFFDYWTLKESYIKARGLGLSLPLRHFTFLRTPDLPPSITFAPELPDEPASWQFAQFWPTAEHRMAVAVRRLGADLPIRVVQHTVPEVPQA